MRHLLVVPFVLAGTMTQAECGYESMIQDAAAAITQNMSYLPVLVQRNYGSDAIYLRIRYFPRTTPDIARGFVGFGGAQTPRRAEEIFTAFENSLIPDPDFDALFPDVDTALYSAHDLLVFARPELGAELIDWYLSLENARVAMGTFSILALSLPDEVRLDWAKLAEEKGAINIAAEVLLAADNRDAFDAFDVKHHILERFPNDFGLMVPVAYLTDDRPLILDLGNPHFLEKVQLAKIMSAEMHGGVGIGLSNLANQTGELAAIASVADAYLAEVRSGRIDPATDQEAAWAFTYAGLVDALGQDKVARYADAYEVRAGMRHYRGTSLAVYEWAAAVETIRPYLTGEVDMIPTKPDLVGKYVDWAVWTDVAEEVRSLAAGDDEDNAPVVFEQLWAMGSYRDALEYATSLSDLQVALDLLRDGMLRLDHQCQQATVFPGQSLLFGGQYPFVFPQQ